LRLVCSVLLALVFSTALPGCSPALPDEERIRALLQGMTQALEERETSKVLAPLAEDFVGETWDLDVRALRMILRREMLAHDRLRARLFDIDVDLLSENRAQVSFQVLLTGGSGLFPSEGRWFQVETGWRLDDEWQLISARWEDVIGR
jgi:hypothetical protein